MVIFYYMPKKNAAEVRRELAEYARKREEEAGKLAELRAKGLLPKEGEYVGKRRGLLNGNEGNFPASGGDELR